MENCCVTGCFRSVLCCHWCEWLRARERKKKQQQKVGKTPEYLWILINGKQVETTVCDVINKTDSKMVSMAYLKSFVWLEIMCDVWISVCASCLAKNVSIKSKVRIDFQGGVNVNVVWVDFDVQTYFCLSHHVIDFEIQGESKKIERHPINEFGIDFHRLKMPFLRIKQCFGWKIHSMLENV